MKILIQVILLCVCSNLYSQQKKFIRLFQISLTPGLSSNGLHPGGFKNYFSVNLSSGYSSANYLLELGLISNLNEAETRGLQIAGVANLTGANAFSRMYPKEIEKKKKEGFEANLSGLQFSGLTNVVLNNVFGGQFTGGFNVAKGSLQGVQLSGLSNTVSKFSFGIQFAGIYNISVESMDGVQLAGLFNVTTGGLYGAQISMFNKAGFIEGINSFDDSFVTGLQIGLINQASSMNGYQVGLINIGKRMQGTQLGLVNIFHDGKTPETRDGTSIGLINIGSSGYVSAYSNEFFYSNIEISTGTVKNRRMTNDVKEKQVQNALIYSTGSVKGSKSWAIGYGLKKMFFNRSLSPGYGHFRFFSVGVDWLHVNHEQKKFTKELSLLTRPSVAVGSRLHPKNKIFFLFTSVSYNFYKSGSGKMVSTISEKSNEEQLSGIQHWPGLSFGVLIQ